MNLIMYKSYKTTFLTIALYVLHSDSQSLPVNIDTAKYTLVFQAATNSGKKTTHVLACMIL